MSFSACDAHLAQLNCMEQQRRKSDGVSLCLSLLCIVRSVSLPVAPFWCQPTIICQRFKQTGYVGWSRKRKKLGEQGVFGGAGWKQEEGWVGRGERGRKICPWACFVLNTTPHSSLFNSFTTKHRSHKPACATTSLFVVLINKHTRVTLNDSGGH